MPNKDTILYRTMSPTDFPSIISLGNYVHGDGYLDKDNIEKMVSTRIKEPY